ncbi:alpha-2-macroglobulin receptor-associated protein [Echinops telfairi]|uniref:Alpha-2-macroglobulin receptor-associated protein n=1 Tax=Echinops telfairi TaxID=9371 RepID=A0AC55D0X7_ECHTE|nr:alpha-2-macroglobulin receptor-associated protein [Echinops telfairi]
MAFPLDLPVRRRLRLCRRSAGGLQSPECHAAGRARRAGPRASPGVPRGRAHGSVRMVSPLLVISLLALLLGPAAGHGGKYSREKNEPAPTPKREPEGFRMEKLNQLWEKAKRSVSLLVILAKYGLDGRKDTQVADSNFLQDHAPDQGLQDPRLEKLWHKVPPAPCAPQRHHLCHGSLGVCGTRKTTLFPPPALSAPPGCDSALWNRARWEPRLPRTRLVLRGSACVPAETHMNVISPSDMTHLKEEVLQSRHAELKERQRRLQQGFERLRRVSHQGYGTDSEFEEPRVMELWDLAKAANFTEKELEAFREELRHFEVKVEKQQHYQKQLELSHQKLRHVEGAGDPEHLSRSREKYAMLEEKARELGYKVKKHLQDLTGRVSRGRHNEL